MLRHIFAALSLILLTACAPQSASTGVSPRGAARMPDAPSAQVIALINAERASQGRRALTPDSTLTRAATDHAALMVQKGFFSHDIPGGASFGQRMTSAGILRKYTGENIFTGPMIPELAVAQWMNSRGHRRNILDGNFTRIGVGTTGQRYWVAIFSSD